ncbi:MAG: glycine dehydrogenase (aminomethyl-transferring) [Alphaproteobacteria bacterium RIFCSPLOWO2_01_FULL_40_26]|nr:MAG: glycine dehydrogenase (aminomethyl-transferring) [Alphaproteobacteria bacterium RIFCSPHIGHO2_02_FULL_40_34]OFW87110.1 MAG: glycine dehydrogenase (aminomethyl-transferring) [Alphaproteobacteria bacterium RIFCSPHIGHO2_01_FULL_40_8]OFW94683.1 MAG: glycine dehydrogenase (aminomethyl-transferring) [Alphaproteobacteria bacterium RIFCSPLOWO2_01_FULL_40_26]OFX10151.1 MAG: glycine dehydrogenase (aminomethyl-transferring) [Alphaproteobacteria bacterium RIFCSPLOWO2_02_FULL_40_19]OFX11780.1 MAG: gl
MRYLALTKNDRREMLAEIGASSVDHLYDTVPSEFLLKKPIENLPNHQGEIEVENFVKSLANKNRNAAQGPFFLGAGCYRHHIPSAVDHIIQRSEFLTSYTPYQPEISQGTLATIFQFQSIIALLTGMEVANASMYDGATAMAESCLMALRIKAGKKNIAKIDHIHPDYLDVTTTYLDLNETKFVDKIDENCAAAIVQYPNFHGEIGNLDEIRKKCDEAGALLIVVVNEILSLGLLAAPSMADIVVGEASSLGVGLNFGGPLLGFFACKKEFVRQMPGRICGATVDTNGRPGYVLTLNAREQHIRREKATSNICSNQGLCATAFTIHASLLGEIGFKKLALINHKKACDLADMLAKVKGVKILNKNFFNEFTIELGQDAEEINKKLLAKNIIGGFAEGKKMIVAVSELTSANDMENLAQELIN